MKKSPPQSGFVLLEALVGILIFSLGILGIMGFQAAAARITSESRYRTEAALYADELIAKMRVSPPATLIADYDQTTGASFTTWLNSRVKAAPSSGSPGGLPGGAATITVTTDGTTATNTYLINLSISWAGPGTDAGDSGTYATTALIDPN